MLDDGERAPSGVSAEAGVAATKVLDDGERVPFGGSAEAGAAATRMLDMASARATGLLSRGRAGGDEGARSWRALATRQLSRGRGGGDKTDDDTESSERQLVHKRAHAIVFIVLICCLLLAGADFVRPYFSSRPGLLKQLVKQY